MDGKLIAAGYLYFGPKEETLIFTPEGVFFIDCNGVRSAVDHSPYDSSTPWQLPLALPDDAAPPAPISSMPAQSPGIVDGKTQYERRKEEEAELIESNRRARDEIKRILGQ